MGQRFVRVGFGQEGTIDADRSYHYSVNTSCMRIYAMAIGSFTLASM